MATVRLAFALLLGFLVVSPALSIAGESDGLEGTYLLDPWAIDPEPELSTDIPQPLEGRLDIRADGTWALSGPDSFRGDLQGKWHRDGPRIRLQPAAPGERPPVIEGRIEKDRLLLPVPAAHSKTPFQATYRRPGREYRELLHLSPSARAARVRAQLESPGLDESWRFKLGFYDQRGLLTTGVDIEYRAVDLDGRSAWRCSTENFGTEKPVPASVAWLDRDLRLLRREEGDLVVVAVEGGFELRKATDTHLCKTDLGAAMSQAGLFLFLRLCPPETLEYELPFWDLQAGRTVPLRIRVERRRFAVRPGAPVRNVLLASILTQPPNPRGPETFAVTGEDRTPVCTGRGLVVNPEVIGPWERVGYPRFTGNQLSLAWLFQRACLAGDEKLIDELVDWSEVLSGAAEDFAPDPPPTVAAACAALLRFRASLLPGEVDRMLAPAHGERKTTEDGLDVRIACTPESLLSDFDCTIRRTPAGWRIVRLRESLLRGRRHDTDVYPEEASGAKTVEGCRFWLWAREARRGARGAVAALNGFGERALPVLLECAVRGDSAAVKRLSEAGIEALPLVAEAFARADERARSAVARAVVDLLWKSGATADQIQKYIPVLEFTVGSDRNRSATLLARLGEASVPILVKGLEEDGSQRQLACLKALEMIGPPARSAESAVTPFREHPRTTVQVAAMRTLKAIREPQLRVRIVPWDPDAEFGNMRGQVHPQIRLYRDGQFVKTTPRRSAWPTSYGEFGHSGFAPGPHDLLVELEGCGPVVRLDVPLGPALTDLGKVTMPKGTILSFEVVGPVDILPEHSLYARAVRQGRVSYERSGHPRDGRFELPPLGDGTFRVTIWCPPGKSHRGRQLYNEIHEISGDGRKTIRVDAGRPSAVWPKDLALYLGLGEVGGPGTVVQLDGKGVERGSVGLPGTPYGLAANRDGSLIAAIPRRPGELRRIDAAGAVATLQVGRKLLPCPIDLATHPATGDVLVGDNTADALILLPGGDPAKAKRVLAIPGASKTGAESFSVAFAAKGRILLGATRPRGVFLFPLGETPDAENPLLRNYGPVASNPASGRWAVVQRTHLVIHESGKEILKKRVKHVFCLAFAGPDHLVTGHRYRGGVSLLYLLDLNTHEVRLLFRHEGGRLTSMAIGPKQGWKAAADPK